MKDQNYWKMKEMQTKDRCKQEERRQRRTKTRGQMHHSLYPFFPCQMDKSQLQIHSGMTFEHWAFGLTTVAFFSVPFQKFTNRSPIHDALTAAALLETGDKPYSGQKVASQ